MERAKVGNTIEWSFDALHTLAGTYTAKVAIVNVKEKTYGVYADYGQDLIPFEMATIIKIKS